MSRAIDTGTDDLLAEVDGHLGIITFNRPDRRNALSDPMYGGFDRALPALASDPEVRVLVITGAGGAFCAGGDVKGMNESHRMGTPRAGRGGSLEDQVANLRRSQQAVSLALHHFPRPVVAVLPGTAFANVGASGDFGGSWFLTQLVGTAKAKELYFTSPRLTAREAMELGMVNQVLADDNFEQLALDWCRDLAARAPIATRLMKENLNRAITADLATALDAEAPNMIRSMSTADHREAAAAFVEKRSPVFSGE
jgi:2-(1,2-epoxy-1,2-dihydrophenyl)acetyl-CoA isomerase